MVLTKEFLEDQLANMQAQRQQIEVDFHAISGAIKFCAAMIGKLGEEEGKVEEVGGDSCPTKQPLQVLKRTRKS